ncbi:MAG: DNA polymerase III subunit chi [Gammaproteobacteria bacterium]|nr:DNA polymerase III subunit chi [Pseudomonadales bacterium]MCP5346705.1 DNA polymerase III subunit chi [Pseudomonadales bacterium]
MTTPKVSFYPLGKGSSQDTLVFACRLVDKAVQLGHRVHLLARDAAQLKLLDELLWQFQAESFLPHQCLTGESVEADIRVTLGVTDQLPGQRDILINLRDSVWEQHRQFPDIREIVPADAEQRKLGRQRYRYYQEQGYELETMKLGAQGS